jgi:hypothetical protein
MTHEQFWPIIVYVQAAYGQPWHEATEAVWRDVLTHLHITPEHAERAARLMVSRERWPTPAGFCAAVDETRPETEQDRYAELRALRIASQEAQDEIPDPSIRELISQTIASLEAKRGPRPQDPATTADPVDERADVAARERRREHLRRQAEHLRLIDGGRRDREAS